MTANKATILIVEDDHNLALIIKDSLEMNGYAVHHAENGAIGMKLMQQQTVDLCLLDVMMPTMDGFELAKLIRSSNQSIPIIFLTARHLKEDKLEAFRIGADDYLTKPFHLEELVHRIAVFLKRSHISVQDPKSLAFGKYTFLPKKYLLQVDEMEIQLTDKESALLQLLLSHQGAVIKRSDILQQLWGDDDYFMGRSLDVFISRLRKYLQADPNISIRTIHSVGFTLEVDK